MGEHKKPRLLVILGAGSTIHANAPSTKELTDLVRQMADEPIPTVVKHLHEQRAGEYNFETILAALEDLDEYAIRRRHPAAWQRISGHLSAFTEFVPELAKFDENSFLIARTKIIGRIKNFVIEKTRDSSPERLHRFFDQINDAFDLTVLTLNYDDIIDRAGEWYDGFSSTKGSDEFGTFNFLKFPSKSIKHPAVLLHLHGSVRYDFPPWRYTEREIVRYNHPRLGMSVELQAQQNMSIPTPIIAGDGKDRWMTRACTPFGYYYNAFIRNTADLP